MAGPRTLYICPATQAAIVAAAPALLGERGPDIRQVLLLRGVADADRPSAWERIDAIRSAVSIRAFFEQRGAIVHVIDAPADSYETWRTRLAEALNADLLKDVDQIVFNAQAGTKQMSFGAWDGIAAAGGAGGGNLTLLRAFVSPGSTSVTMDGVRVGSPQITIEDYLAAYGFREVEQSLRLKRENWARREALLILNYGSARLSEEPDRIANITIDRLTNGEVNRLWSGNNFTLGGGWLEAWIYVRTLQMLTSQGLPPGRVAGFMKIKDTASGAHIPSRFDQDHEADLVTLSGGRLGLLECKSGKPKSTEWKDFLNKQIMLRDLLQGRAGVNAIVAPATPSPATRTGRRASLHQIELVPAQAPLIDALIQRMIE